MLRRSRVRALLVATTAAAACAVPLTLGAAPAGAASIRLTPTGTVLVTMKGNGHGHGLSQYGARGAAIAGRSYRAILGFYYPGSTLSTLPATTIRVRLSGFGTTTTVAAQTNLGVSGVPGVLPSRGIARYRLVADAHSTLTLQQLPSAKGAAWKTYRTGLASGAQFTRTGQDPIRVFAPDGSNTVYFGSIRALRAAATGSSAGVFTVDAVNIDQYTAGVVPREMPASWQQAAVDAQAVAARTYGMYAVRYASSSTSDICDNTQCQVYGGHGQYDSSGRQLTRDDPQAAADTANQVLMYRGATVFAQFAASDGGWTADGGQPYLTAHADPYDDAASGDPYLSYSKRVTVASIADYYGLAKVTSITVTARDGHGMWGGRMTAGSVTGTTSAGRASTVTTTGVGLQNAVDSGTTWFVLSDPR